MSHNAYHRRPGIAVGLGIAAGAVLAAGLIPLAAGVARADDHDFDGSAGTSAGGSASVTGPFDISDGSSVGGSGRLGDNGGRLSTGGSDNFGGPLGSFRDSAGLDTGVAFPGF